MIRWFAEVGAGDTALVGGKGANLGECIRAGLPVPPGFCVSTRAYRAVTEPVAEELLAAVARGAASEARALVAGLGLPPEVSAAIVDAYRKLGEPVVAVRSSATAEDLAAASFAGQQDTYLGVQGAPALLETVQQCWASLWTDRAVAYRARRGVAQDGLALAVVVQELVTPDVAGVLFTQDPVSGDPAQLLASASYGLGESVVAALVTPDNFRLRRDPPALLDSQLGSKQTRIDPSPAGGTVTSAVPAADQERACLSEAQLLDLLRLGVQVEAHYGQGQDIEWAYSGAELYLLQARPITTQVRAREGHAAVKGRLANTLRDDLIEHYPAPYPLDLHAVHRIQDVLQQLIGELGVVAVPSSSLLVGDADGVIRTKVTAPRLRVRMLWRIPAFIRTVQRHDPASWSAEQVLLRSAREQLLQRAEARASSTDSELRDLWNDALEQGIEVTHDRFVNYLAPMMLLRRRAQGLIKRAGLAGAVTPEDCYAGLEYVTAEVARGLNRLAELARRTGVGELVVADPAGAAGALRSLPAGAELVAAVDAFLADYGARTARMYLPFSARSWREEPTSFYALLAAAVAGTESQSPAAGAAIEAVAGKLGGRSRRRWLETVTELRALHLAREATVYWIEDFFTLARAAADEIARRLVLRAQLSEADDLKYCYLEEVDQALVEAGFDLRDRVACRRQLRGVAEAIWWDRGEVRTADSLQGVPASSGRASGPARIVRGPGDFGRLQAGDILVCPYTDPTWTPLFSLAAAVVADTGGPLSHAAIVAREVGIPAVLGVQQATSGIADGGKILVDGTAGTVTLRS